MPARQPTFCMIFEAIGPYNAIGKIAMAEVEHALAAGYRVSVVATRLDESLHDRVEWLKLYNPPRGFLLKWLTARHFIKKAIGNRKFDIIHAHQPQVADLSDVFQCHFITRVAYERNCLSSGTGLRAAVGTAQTKAAMLAEDRFYQNWNPRTRMIFCSGLLASEFARLYGPPPLHQVLTNPCSPVRFASDEDRRTARKKFLGSDHEGLVLGYLGGLQVRKGYHLLVEALRGQKDVFLLAGGQHTAEFAPPELAGHCKGVGLVGDTAAFYAACDAIAVPSLFDPCPVVVFEAATRGTPVIATDGVGNLPDLLRHDAGVAWAPGRPLTPLVRDLASRREHYRIGIEKMAEHLSQTNYFQRLFSIYDEVLREKGIAPPSHAHSVQAIEVGR